VIYRWCYIYSESKKSPPPEVLWKFFQNGWEFLDQILRAYYVFLSMLDYEILFNCLQRWRSYAILSVTTHFKSCAQNVHHWTKRTLAFSDIFPKQEFLVQILHAYYTFISTLDYEILFTYLHSPTVTKLCHIKCDHPACVSVNGGHFEHIMVGALNTA